VILAIIVIALLVLLVIVDGSDTSGAHQGAPPEVESFQQEDAERSTAGSPCILNVTSVSRGDEREKRRRSWRPARQGQAETSQR
jgi:hypothetical protein